MKDHLKQNFVLRQYRRNIISPSLVAIAGVMRRTRNLLLFALAVTFGLATLGAPAAFGQDTTATILGTVTDPTGATVANADVKVTNTQTGIVVAVSTTDSGAYTVPQLNPGTYSVNIKVAGFQTANIPSLAVSTGAVLTLR